VKNKLILILTSALMIFCAGIYQQHLQARGSDVRLLDVNRILKSYGFKGGEISFASNSPVHKLDFLSQMTYGAIEETGAIDTAEEFITAVYYSPIELSASAKKSILAELPEGKTGALRLAAMWLKKRAEEDGTGYIKAIEIIKEKSGITESEINTFFAAAIEKEVMKQGKVYLGKYYSGDKLKDAVRPLVEYYINPTKENLEKLDDAHSSVKSPSAYIDLIREVGGLGGNSLTTKVILYSH